MKRLILPFVILGLVSGCQATEVDLRPTDDIARTQSPDSRACNQSYRHREVWLVEHRCADQPPGITLIDAAGTRRFASYDPAFTDWAWQEDCNREDGCFYTLSLDAQGRITGFAYHFDINLSEGVIRVRVDAGRLVVTDRRIIDHPS
ncbi:hypothetical protein [Denitromonas sp.]|uniref:hypothetical protein n=1 Tax=Denitromonas sp. TaxID=2734609 RepID=UPI002AFFAE7A|nr:hypothetical protein [Denitromonas sp.]